MTLDLHSIGLAVSNLRFHLEDLKILERVYEGGLHSHMK